MRQQASALYPFFSTSITQIPVGLTWLLQVQLDSSQIRLNGLLLAPKKNLLLVPLKKIIPCSYSSEHLFISPFHKSQSLSVAHCCYASLVTGHVH